MESVNGLRIRTYRAYKSLDDSTVEEACILESDYAAAVYATNTKMKAYALEQRGGDPAQHLRDAQSVPESAFLDRKFFVFCVCYLCFLIEK